MRVLRGAIATIERCSPALFIEVDDAALRTQRSTADELVAFLAAYGYRPYRLRRRGPPQPISPHALGRDRYENVLFLNNHCTSRHHNALMRKNAKTTMRISIIPWLKREICVSP